VNARIDAEFPRHLLNSKATKASESHEITPKLHQTEKDGWIMPSVLKQGDSKWRAFVSRNGARKSKVFRSKRDAERWAAIEDNKILIESETRKSILGDSAKLSSSDSALVKSMLGKQTEVHFGPGIYGLFVHGELVYIGQSKNVFSRISEHARRGRKFTHYNIIPCTEYELDYFEALLIEKLSPSQNISTGSGKFSRKSQSPTLTKTP